MAFQAVVCLKSSAQHLFQLIADSPLKIEQFNQEQRKLWSVA